MTIAFEAARVLLGKPHDRGLREVGLRQIDECNVELSREEVEQLVLFDVAKLDQDLAEPQAALLLRLEGERQLLGCQQPVLDEEFAYPQLAPQDLPPAGSEGHYSRLDVAPRLRPEP